MWSNCSSSGVGGSASGPAAGGVAGFALFGPALPFWPGVVGAGLLEPDVPLAPGAMGVPLAPGVVGAPLGLFWPEGACVPGVPLLLLKLAGVVMPALSDGL